MIRYDSIIYLKIFLCILFLSFPFGHTIQAKKTHTALYGCVYMADGDSIVADGKLRVGLPIKKRKLEIIKNAYTKNSCVSTRINPSDIDFVKIWTPTAPENPHTFRFIQKYGWCWEAEHSPYISVFCYTPKGYYLSGNGGLWLRGKGNIFLIKDGKIYDFGLPEKRIDKKMRALLENLISDDPGLSEYIRNAKGRRDKILRKLIIYKPK